jgi:hypothetical protein
LQSKSDLKAIIYYSDIGNSKLQKNSYMLFIDGDVETFGRFQSQNRIEDLQTHFVLLSVLNYNNKL